MSTIGTQSPLLSTPADEFDDFQSYRALSRTAILSLILGMLSLLGLLFPVLLVLAAGGAIMGVMALVSIRRYPDEISGTAPAWSGVVLCSAMLVGGVSKHTVEYITEVPEGYERISFAVLQPDKAAPQSPVPPAALELDGKRVFVEGYVHPGVSGQGKIKQFVLVPDMGTCCFGGQPKLTDMIEVTLRNPLTTQYNQRKRKLAGVLKVNEQLKPISGLEGVYYQLEVDYLD